MNHGNAAVDNVFTDIETIPTQRDDVKASIRNKLDDELEAKLAEVKAPSNYKDEAKIAEFIGSKKAEIRLELAGKFDDAHHATGLDGAFGELYCIAAAANKGIAVCFDRRDDMTANGERRLLKDFFGWVYDTTELHNRKRLIGHNIVGFDIRFILQRSMVLGVKPPGWWPIDPKPWEDTVYDTMVRWAGVGQRVKLSKLCMAFGIEDTDEIDGSEVWGCVQRGEGQKVIDHCLIDVDKVRRVFNHMTFNA